LTVADIETPAIGISWNRYTMIYDNGRTRGSSLFPVGSAFRQKAVTGQRGLQMWEGS